MSAKKVLIVDDDLADVYLLEKTLRQPGVLNLDCVMSADHASRYISTLSLQNRLLRDLIFVDLKMAGSDGFQLISWFKGEPTYCDIPLVVFSNSTDPADKEKALALGARAFFQKTLEADKLKAIVENVLPLRRGSDPSE
ncbi:MAG: response regulator [Verrucomicrobiota bacterium]